MPPKPDKYKKPLTPEQKRAAKEARRKAEKSKKKAEDAARKVQAMRRDAELNVRKAKAAARKVRRRRASMERRIEGLTYDKDEQYRDRMGGVPQSSRPRPEGTRTPTHKQARSEHIYGPPGGGYNKGHPSFFSDLRDAVNERERKWKAKEDKEDTERKIIEAEEDERRGYGKSPYT